MTQIKCKKAKEWVAEHTLSKRFNDGEDHPCVRAETATLAIHYAELEAHDRAIEAFKRCCQYRTDILCSDLDHRSNECNSDCVGVKIFINELNK